MLFLLLMLYFATRRLFRPIDTINQGVQKFGAGDMDYRVQVERKDELGELANTFNTMANEIQQMLDAKRQLLLAISHELRSPLTRARVAVELLGEEDKKAAIVQDISEMESLIWHFKLIYDGIKVPAGHAYSCTEGGNGELGFHIVSDGSGTPYRVRVRPPCWYNLAASREMLLGGMIADIIPTFGSVNMIGGECDR